VIPKQEIMALSAQLQLQAHVVEKDYALGWFLAGIAAHPEIGPRWVFKGGTCLKKCYFETYRFSEDLDFTLQDASHLDEAFLARVFEEVGEWIYEASGLEFPMEARKFEVFTNNRGTQSAQGKVGYRGPLGRAGDPPRVKLDLAADEVLVLDPVMRRVYHPYTDLPEDGIRMLCYPFEEVFAEKMRALAERQRPRDLYDVVHLFRRQDLQPDRAVVRSTLARKCEFKGIPVPTFDALSNRRERAAIEVEWEQMLAHQLPYARPSSSSGRSCPRSSSGSTRTTYRMPCRPSSSAGTLSIRHGACRQWSRRGARAQVRSNSSASRPRTACVSNSTTPRKAASERRRPSSLTPFGVLGPAIFCSMP